MVWQIRLVLTILVIGIGKSWKEYNCKNDADKLVANHVENSLMGTLKILNMKYNNIIRTNIVLFKAESDLIKKP